MPRHPYADTIIAWAEGAQVEYKYDDKWYLSETPCFDAYSEWRIKSQPKPWQETIPEHGTLCWVSHNSRFEKKSIAVIVRQRFDRYEDIYGTEWFCAEPLTNDEIRRFLRPEEE